MTNLPAKRPGPGPTFDENGNVVMTEEDYTLFAKKINEVHLPIEKRTPILIKFLTRRITEKEYHRELFKARFCHLLDGMIEECDYWIQLEGDLARLEGEGGISI